uniref:Uncharacterized protein n=2 Tax=Magallana TaxID=2171616 RepID=A0A8W8LCJ9_MAGGI
RISNLPCYQSRDRLCQSEISKRLSVLFHTILNLQGDQDLSVRLMAPYIGQLPMPEDYRLQELSSLTRNFSASYLRL